MSVPEGWKETRLEEIADVQSGGTPSRKNGSYWQGGAIPWVTTAELCQKKIYNSVEKITHAGLENSSAKIFSAGTLLVAMYGQGKTRGQVAELTIDAARQQKKALMQQLLTGKKRLPGFSEEWNKKSLDNFCTMKSGEQITSRNLTALGEFPCYGGNGFRGNTNSYTHNGHYILIGRQGALCGNVLEVKGKFFASEHAIVVTPINNSPTYMSYMLNAKKT